MAPGCCSRASRTTSVQPLKPITCAANKSGSACPSAAASFAARSSSRTQKAGWLGCMLGAGGVPVPLAQGIEVGRSGGTQDEQEGHGQERQGREAEATARREDLIRSRFLLSAQSKGSVDPDVAFVIAKGLPEFAGVKLDDEGNVAGIDAVIESLVTSKPYLVSQTQHKPQSVGAASKPAPQSPPPPKNLAEAGDRLEQALRTGVT